MDPVSPLPFTVPRLGTVVLGLPVPDPFTRTYWDALAQGQLLVRRCGSCGGAFHPPRPLCPICWSDAVSWERVSGRGTIYSFSIVRENDLSLYRETVPYVVAIVELDVGARLMTQIVESDPASIRVGAPVAVHFVERDGFTHPVFSTAVPAGGGS